MNKELGMEDVRRIQVDILKAVTDFCTKNGLRYSLAYGSMLGAVRHQGYIPWDDDIDLFMPRPDYEKFTEKFNGTYNNLRFHCYENDKRFPYVFGKVEDTSTLLIERSDHSFPLGINMDIFPIDGMPTGDEEIVAETRRMFRRRRLMECKKISLSGNRSLIKNLVLAAGKLALLPVPLNKLVADFIKSAKKYGYEDCEYVADWTFQRVGRKFRKQFFEETIPMQFEDGQYEVSEHYDTILTMIFQDYMQLPPVEKQVTHHRYKAYLK